MSARRIVDLISDGFQWTPPPLLAGRPSAVVYQAFLKAKEAEREKRIAKMGTEQEGKMLSAEALLGDLDAADYADFMRRRAERRQGCDPSLWSIPLTSRGAGGREAR